MGPTEGLRVRGAISSGTRDPRARPAARPAHVAWVPRQHGAWAMLAVPLLIGVAVSRPSPWQLLLAATAVCGYLASAAAQTWLRARHRAPPPRPMIAWGSGFVALGSIMVVACPALLLGLVVLVPTAAVIIAGARPGTRRDLANSLAQVLQALVLVPAAAAVTARFEVSTVVAATAVAAGFLTGSVLVVRSVLRERGEARFALASIAFHAALTAGAAVALPAAYPILGAALTARAAALPLLRQVLARRGRTLRPVHVGIVELAASAATVLVAFVAVP